MNRSFLLAVSAALIITAGLVAGQTAGPYPAYEKPVDRQWDGQSSFKCHEKMVQSLIDATDLADPNQEKYLRAAEAYRLLGEAGQRCP